GGATTPAGGAAGNAPGIPPLAGPVQQGANGLQYIDELPGSGAVVRAGQRVSVHYTGWLTSGRKFDSSRDRGQPFAFTVGAGQVIAGWDQGVAGMQVGGKRRLILPPALGYGAGGFPPVIPGNATLIFDVEVLAVQ
ncbi:MAG: FKBP-type peptidyl-prolyl cis-trans isomerase, partial [Chloroflexi bacterium]|nr:FKBP-type peptidyl-prolyl cis-trans isomerase [Chloroflexota bacterium]